MISCAYCKYEHKAIEADYTKIFNSSSIMAGAFGLLIPQVCFYFTCSKCKQKFEYDGENSYKSKTMSNN